MFCARFAAGGVFPFGPQQHKSPVVSVWLRGWVCVKLHVSNNCMLNVTVPMWWIWGRLIAPEAVYCRCNVAACFIAAADVTCSFLWQAGKFNLRRRHQRNDWQEKVQQRLPFTPQNATGWVRRDWKAEVWMPEIRGQIWHSQNKLCF